MDGKLISSATAMVPCPWFTEVAAYARAHPDADIGLHLTLTAEWQTFRWGPIAPRALVPSLIGPDGYFYSDSGEVAKTCQARRSRDRNSSADRTGQGHGPHAFASRCPHARALCDAGAVWGPSESCARIQTPYPHGTQRNHISVQASSCWLRVIQSPMRSFHPGLMCL